MLSLRFCRMFLCTFCVYDCSCVTGYFIFAKLWNFPPFSWTLHSGNSEASAPLSSVNSIVNNFAIIFSKSTHLYNWFSVSVSVYSLPGKNAAIQYTAKYNGWRLLRACLHGGGRPQVGEVTRLGGVTRLSIQSLILRWLRLHVRWGNPPHVTSRTWGPPPSCKQALKLHLWNN